VVIACGVDAVEAVSRRGELSGVLVAAGHRIRRGAKVRPRARVGTSIISTNDWRRIVLLVRRAERRIRSSCRVFLDSCFLVHPLLEPNRPHALCFRLESASKSKIYMETALCRSSNGDHPQDSFDFIFGIAAARATGGLAAFHAIFPRSVGFGQRKPQQN